MVRELIDEKVAKATMKRVAGKPQADPVVRKELQRRLTILDRDNKFGKPAFNISKTIKRKVKVVQ